MFNELLKDDRVRLCGYSLTPASLDQIVSLISEAVREGSGGTVVTLNVDYISQGLKNSWLRDNVQSADIIVPDGAPVLWGVHRKCPKYRHLRRVTGVDISSEVAQRISPELGAIIGGRDPRLALENLVGVNDASQWYVNSDSIEMTDGYVEMLIQQLKGRRLVLVGLGVPKQEALIARLKPHMPEAVFIGIGGSMDFHAGLTRRAPAWMQRSGLEWLHRLVQEPKRLWRRYLIDYHPGVRAIVQDVRTGT